MCSGSVSWAATALTGAFFVSAAQWQGLQHVCRVCGKGCSMFAGSVSDSMLLVQASLQACSTVARAAACLQDQFKAGLQHSGKSCCMFAGSV